MALYTPFFERGAERVGQAYGEQKIGKLAQAAYMGDQQALGELYRFNPELGNQIRQQKMQEEQTKLATTAANQNIRQNDQQWAMQNRQILEQALQRAAMQPDFPSGQAVLAREIQSLRDSGVQVPESLSEKTFTPEMFTQIQQVYAQPEAVAASQVTPEGQALYRMPGGAIKAVDIPNFKRDQKDVKIDFMQRVMPDGTIQTVMADPSGKFFDLQGGAIQIGPEERLIEGTTLTGGVDDLGLSNTEATKMRDAEVATRSFMATANDALQLLNENPDINTFVASAAGTINNLQQEARALARNTGMEFDESLLDPSKHNATFDELGIRQAQMKSLITSLAYTQALANNPDGRVSNADLERAIQEVGGSAADPRAFAQTLMDVAQRTDRRFKIDYETRLKKPFEGDTGFSELSGFQSGAPAVTTQAEYDALPSGATYMEDGVEYRKP